MKNKGLLSFVVALCLLVASPQPMFADSGMMYQHQDTEGYTKALTELGVFSLYDEELFFGESEAVKRYEAAKALVDVFGYANIGASDVSHIFYDVPSYYEHAASIAVAYNMGIMKGVGGGLFAPEDNIITGHFVKALINTLGYDWKASLQGGYPVGYYAVAVELEMLNGVLADMNAELTRGDLVKILYNTLETPVCVQDGFSGDSGTFTIDEDVTLLSYYHDVYSGTATVNSNRTVSLVSGFEANEEKVLVGNDELKTNDNSSPVFGCIGYEVDYFYRSINDGKAKELITYAITDSQSVVDIFSKNVNSASSSKVVAQEGDKEFTYNISAAADFFYNERPLTASINAYMSGFDGSVRLIDTDNDKKYDYCLICDYEYDMVTITDARTERIYCENSSYDLKKAEIAFIQNVAGKTLTIADVTTDSVIAVAKSEAEDFVKVVVLDKGMQVSVEEKSTNGIITADGDEYEYSKSLPQSKKDLAGLGKMVVLTFNELGEIVWISELGDSLNLGYLIKTETSVVGGLEEPQVRVTILNTAGSVKRYMCAKKVSVDGTPKEYDQLAAHLADVKRTIGATGDGPTSQVVYYRVNDEELLTELYTANPVGGKIQVRFTVDDITTKKIQNQGNNSGVYDGGKYAVSQAVPIFRVPKTNQESYDDAYFNVTGYLKDGGPTGNDSELELDGYSQKEDDVLCSAFVMYQTATNQLSAQASFFLVDSVSSVVNADGDACHKLSGWYKDGFYSYEADPSAIFPSELTKGDVVVFNLDASNNISLIDKVYDYETTTLSPSYSSHGNTVTGGERKVFLTEVYNAPAGSSFAEAYQTNITSTRPSAEHLVCLNFIALNGTKNVFSFDIVTEEIIKGYPPRLQDWLNAKGDRAKVLVRYSYGYPQDYIIYQ